MSPIDRAGGQARCLPIAEDRCLLRVSSAWTALLWAAFSADSKVSLPNRLLLERKGETIRWTPKWRRFHMQTCPRQPARRHTLLGRQGRDRMNMFLCVSRASLGEWTRVRQPSCRRPKPCWATVGKQRRDRTRPEVHRPIYGRPPSKKRITGFLPCNVKQRKTKLNACAAAMGSDYEKSFAPPCHLVQSPCARFVVPTEPELPRLWHCVLFQSPLHSGSELLDR